MSQRLVHPEKARAHPVPDGLAHPGVGRKPVLESDIFSGSDHLFVAAGDGDTAKKGFRVAVNKVNAAHGPFPVLVPTPHLQAWLTSKRAVERAYGRQHCTVPEVSEAALRLNAKAELKRLLGSFGGTFSATRQARLAEAISGEDLERFQWSRWTEAREALEAALVISVLGP